MNVRTGRTVDENIGSGSFYRVRSKNRISRIRLLLKQVCLRVLKTLHEQKGVNVKGERTLPD